MGKRDNKVLLPMLKDIKYEPKDISFTKGRPITFKIRASSTPVRNFSDSAVEDKRHDYIRVRSAINREKNMEK